MPCSDISTHTNGINRMGKRDVLIAKYVKDLTEKFGEKRPDMALLTAVTAGCGPSIYNKDACKVSATDPKEVARVKKSFVLGKLGVKATDAAIDKAIAKVLADYGKGVRNKYRAVIYYRLTKAFRKQSLYK